jgi:heat-inducible transcriptional repressor
MDEIDNIACNKRYVEVFRKLVEIHVETGAAVGSRCISEALPTPLSAATIRSVMAHLENLGILSSEHTSAGRKPTEKGWRLFVNTLIKTANISDLEKEAMARIVQNLSGRSVETVLEQAIEILSALSNCVSLITVPTANSAVQYIDFVLLGPGKVIVVIVSQNGVVENRLIEVASEISASELDKVTRYINTKLSGLTLEEIRNRIHDELEIQKDGIDNLTKDIVEQGIGYIVEESSNRVIVKGHSNLLEKAEEISDLKDLLRQLDEKKTLKNILDESIAAKGVQIFIGAETKMFAMTGCSMIVAPYQDNKKNLVGAIGVIGPSRMRYSRVITLVDYTAKLLSCIT